MAYVPSVNDVTLKLDIVALNSEQLQAQVTYHVNNPDAVGQAATIVVQTMENGNVVDIKQIFTSGLKLDNIVAFFIPNYPSHNRSVTTTAYMFYGNSAAPLAHPVSEDLGAGTQVGGGNTQVLNKVVLIDTFCGTVRAVMTPSELTDWQNIQGTMTKDPRFDSNVPNSLNFRVLDGTVFDSSTVISAYAQIKSCYDAHPNGSSNSQISNRDIGIILAGVIAVGGIGWLAFRKKR